MVNDQLGIIVQAILDTSNIGEKDFEKVKKIAEKYTVDITAKMDTDELVKSVKSVLPKIISEINSKHGLKIPLDVDDKLVYKTVNQLEKNLEKTLSQTNKIQLSIDTEKYSTEIFKLKQQLSNFGAESGVAFTNATQSLNQLEIAYNNMKSSTGDKRLEYEKEYHKQLVTNKNLLSQITSVRDNTLISTIDEKRVNLINKLNKYLDSNSKMNKKKQADYSGTDNNPCII